MKIYAIANAKGGIGKTISTVNIAAAMTKKGCRVLVIDLDRQCNSGLALGYPKDDLSKLPSVFDSMLDSEKYPLSKAIIHTRFENLDLIPSNYKMEQIENLLSSYPGRESLLLDAFDMSREELEEQYDYVLVDCPPSLENLTSNGWVLANDLIIPVYNAFAVDGIHDLFNMVRKFKKRLNRNLDIMGLFYTKYKKTNANDSNIETLRSNFGNLVFNTIIRESTQVENAIDNGMPVVFYAPYSTVSLDYISLTEEVLLRGQDDKQ